MALVVEDGTGKSDADSFISDADAVSYFTAIGDATFTAASSTAREQALRRAQQYITRRYRGRWKGRRVYQTQALDWPRYSVSDVDGWTIQSNVVPTEVKQAQCELALAALSEDLMPTIDKPGDIASVSQSVGSVSQSISYVNGRSQVKQYSKAEALLAHLLTSGGCQVDVERS